MSSKLPIATQAPIATLVQAASNKDCRYSLLYFNIHARGEFIRNILAYVGARWDEIEVDIKDWPSHKKLMRFGHLPALYEIHMDGTTLELAESQAIERYLARKYGLLGSNVWEEHLVNEYYLNTEALNLHLARYGPFISAPTPEARVEAYNKLVDNEVAHWISKHESYLQANGSNGHYVGNETTLADLKTHFQMERFLFYRPTGAKEPGFSAEKTPALWKLKETVERDSKTFVEWLHSDRHKVLDETTRRFFNFQ